MKASRLLRKVEQLLADTETNAPLGIVMLRFARRDIYNLLAWMRAHKLDWDVELSVTKNRDRKGA